MGQRRAAREDGEIGDLVAGAVQLLQRSVPGNAAQADDAAVFDVEPLEAQAVVEVGDRLDRVVGQVQLPQLRERREGRDVRDGVVRQVSNVASAVISRLNLSSVSVSEISSFGRSCIPCTPAGCASLSPRSSMISSYSV